MTDTSVADDSGAGLTPVQSMDPIPLLTSLPIYETLTSSIFDQAQKPEVDPTTGKIKKPPVGQNIDDLVSFGTKVQAQMAGIVGQVQAIADKNNQVAVDTQKAIEDSGLQDKTILDIKAAQTMKTEKHNAEFAGAIGVDPNQASYTLLEEGAKLRQQRLDLEDLGAKAQKEASASLFSDPGQFLLNSITGPVAQKGYAVALERYKGQVAAIQGAEAAVSDVSVRNAALDQVTTTAGVAALQSKIADDTTEKANASKQDALKFNLSSISPIMQATSEQFHTALGINNALVQQQSLQLEKEGFEFRKGEAEFTEIKKQEQIDLLKDNAEARASKEADLKSMNERMGTNISFQDYRLMGDKERGVVDNMVVANKYSGAAGSSPATAIENFNNIPSAINVGLDRTKNLLETAIEKGRVTNSSGIPYHQLAPAERLALDNKSAVLYSRQSYLGGIPDTGNIYSLPSLSRMIGMPQVVGSELAESLKPLASNSTYETKATDVLTHASDLVQKGVPLSKVAAQVSTLYKAGMLQNNVDGQYDKFRIQMLDPTVTGFKVQIPGLGLIDMSNPTRVAQAISRQTLNNKLQTITRSHVLAPQLQQNYTDAQAQAAAEGGTP